MEAAETTQGFRSESQRRLFYTEYQPHTISVSGKEIQPVISANVIYFGGTFETPSAPSTSDLRQSWADYGGSTSFAFLPTEDIRDVYRFIEERGLKDVVLAGFSQGAMRAIELAKLIQQQGLNVSVNGLVLLAPTALYDQKDFQLAVNFVLDSLAKTPLGIVRRKEFLGRGIGVLREFLPGGVPKPPQGVERNAPPLRQQVSSMSRIHPDLVVSRYQLF